MLMMYDQDSFIVDLRIFIRVLTILPHIYDAQ